MINLRDRRLQLGLTMKDVANAVGVSEGTVSKWENGHIQNMRRDRIKKYADILRVSPLDITFDEDPSDPTETVEADLIPYLEKLRRRPELKILFDATDEATPEQLQVIVQMVEAFKK